MGANAIGTGLYIVQEVLWGEQRLQLKYSFHETHFSAKRPNVLGNNFVETILKDYNGQTYWLSANIHSFFPESKLLKWLNLAMGYGVSGFFTGVYKTSVVAFQNQNRERRFYLSLDIDLTRITTQSYVLKTLFDIFNTIKTPFPTVEFIGKNDIKLRAIYF